MHAHGQRRASCMFRHRWTEPTAAVLALTAAVLSNCVRLAHSMRGLVEGDETIEVYVNGVYIMSDTVSPVLPYNSQRRYYYDPDRGAWALRLDNELVPGDVIGLKALSTLREFMPVPQPIGTVIEVPGLVGVIAAFEDGTMTNDQWKCSDEYIDGEPPIGWQQPRYNDSEWPFARVLHRNCCPWRDPSHAWKRLNAEWIGPQLRNITGPRQFICRYTIKEKPRVMDGSEINGNDTLAPPLNVLELNVGASLTQVKFSLGSYARVSCELVDARYELRAPTPLELHDSGVTMQLGGTVSNWKDVTGSNDGKGYNNTALKWVTVNSAAQCTQQCESDIGCTAITYYDIGKDTATGHNCKLMAALNGTVINLPDAMLTHMQKEATAEAHKMTISGLLLPGTVYNVYCSAIDFVTGKHTTWERVAAMKKSARTAGCFDCGEQDLPITKLLGGFATRDTILAVVESSQAGRVICLARELASVATPLTLTSDEVKANQTYAGLVTRPGSSAVIEITGLRNGTLHEVGCMAESEAGKDSSTANFDKQLRLWYTEEDEVPLVSLRITPSIYRDALSMTTRARMSSIGYLWCQVFESQVVENTGVPTMGMLKEVGLRLRVRDYRIDAGGVFGDLFTNTTYEVFCSAMWSDFRNDTDAEDDFAPDYPVVSILRWTVGYDEVTLIVNIDKGPASTFCRAIPFSRRPYTKRPEIPSAEFMKESQFAKVTQDDLGGDTIMIIKGLDSGWWHDIFCYSEEYKEPPPRGAEPPIARGMTPEKIRQTRLKIRTRGPLAKDGAWHCISGHACGISGLSGEGITSSDKVMARPDQCPGRCLCSGDEDLDKKGASCSPVSHSRLVNPPEPGMELEPDDRDPRGPWCYVNPGDCADAEKSRTFPSQLVSYMACAFQNSTIDRPGIGPPGFPDNGLAKPATLDGTSWFWRGGPLVAPGLGYHLCWCNGTSSPCAAVSDFRLRVGIMDLTGPSSDQVETQMSCIAGKPCTLRYFKGYGLADGNRLVPVPLTAAGCNWERDNPADPLAPPGFPNNGITLPATYSGHVYSWGTEPVRAEGGLYVLCWCGTLAPNGSIDCPLERPVDGSHFLAPGGYLAVIGPRTGSTFFCSVGVECTIQGVPGYGFQGGDLVAVLEECGMPASAPLGWTTDMPDALFEVAATSLSERWGEGGWIAYGPELANDVLNASGSPLHANGSDLRGIWGFPNQGMSVPDPRLGYYGFGEPVQALPGDYALCWCAAEEECKSPEQFTMLVGTLRLEGPAALPGSSQVFNCIRNRQCEILDVEGVWPSSGGQLFIANEGSRCGGPPAVGVPRNGISVPSSDGKSFSWGKLPVISAPGRYRLCWCATIVNCDFGDYFLSFAGIMQIKAPFGPERRFICNVGEPCRLEGIYGIGSSSTDRVMVMTVCEHGVGSDGFENRGISKITAPDGTWFEMPVARSAGRYRVCWCAGELLCILGADFSHDLGTLIVGGPDRSVLYKCHEWAPCKIHPLYGRDLTDGDRLRVVLPGTDCQHNGTIDTVPGFPEDGFSLPATDNGRHHSWGSDKVRTEPGIYGLCWCSALTAPGGVCDKSSSYSLIGGSLEVATAAEYMYINRPPDPESRSEDSFYPFLFIIPTALVFAASAILGWRKLTSRHHDPEAKTPFPKRKAWAAIEQDKARTFHAVKEVAQNRLVALGQVTDITATSITEDDIPQYRAETPAENLRYKAPPKALMDAAGLHPALQDDRPRPAALEDVPSTPERRTHFADDVADIQEYEPRIGTVKMADASQRRGLRQLLTSKILAALGYNHEDEKLALRGVRRQTLVDPEAAMSRGSRMGRGSSRPESPGHLQEDQGIQDRSLRQSAISTYSAASGSQPPPTPPPPDTTANNLPGRASVPSRASVNQTVIQAQMGPPQPAMPGGMDFTPFRDPRRREVLLRILDL